MLLFHRKNRGPAGIRSDAERDRATAQVQFLRAALDKLGSSSAAARCEQMLETRHAEIRDYEALKRGEIQLPPVARLDEIGALVPRIRISRGLTQTELARRLGVSKQVVSRYEETGYRTAGMARLQEILDAIGVKTSIRLEV